MLKAIKMNRLLLVFCVLFLFTSCEVLDLGGSKEEEEEEVVPINEIPVLQLVEADQFGFTVSWNKMEEIDGYSITWELYDSFTGEMLSGYGGSLGSEDTVFTSNTWYVDGQDMVNQEMFCGNRVVVTLKASKGYTSQWVYSEPGTIEFQGGAECEFELRTVGPTEFEVCSQEEDFQWYVPTVQIQNTTYGWNFPFHCHTSSSCFAQNFQIEAWFSSDDQALLDKYNNYLPIAIQNTQNMTGVAGSSSSVGFYKSEECGAGARYLKLHYKLKDWEKETDINEVEFTFLLK